MKPEKSRTYQQLFPSDQLEGFIDSYWEHKNICDEPHRMTIFPDSFFKVIIYLVGGRIVSYFLTGLWNKNMEVIVPPQATVYGVKFKILSPEYIFKREIASLLQSHIELDLDFWNMRNFKFGKFEENINQFEAILIEKLSKNPEVEGKKLQLTQILDKMKGKISAEEVSNQIIWSNRQINRYLNKYLGVSLKSYLNIQRVYAAYIQIREGQFFPDDGFFDQAHFIREVKKHTGKTPRELFKEQHDRFIQLKNIQLK